MSIRKKTPLDISFNFLLIIILLIFIFLPLFKVFAYAFSQKWFPAHWWFPQELGLRNFRQVFSTPDIFNSIVLSYYIAFLVTLLTLIITILAGYVLGTRSFRSNFKSISFVEGLANIPLAFPAITLGIGLLPIYSRLRLTNTITGIVLAHMVMAVPFALRSIVSSFIAIPPDFEEAARNLGARKLHIIRSIYLPLIWPGIFAGAIFAFTWSLNEFVLTLFLGYPYIETIPVQIYHYVGGYYLSPQIAAALSFFLLIPSFLMLFIAEKISKNVTPITLRA